MQDPVRIGLLGCGNVGSALVGLIGDNADVVAARAGVNIKVARIAVRDVARPRGVKVDQSVFTDDAASVVADSDIDVIVEVMGGVDVARKLITDALLAGKPVVTANKELIARHGPELFALAAKAGVDLLFEASVAGGIPLIRPLRESLAGVRIRRVMGIVNGTTNYILTRMTESGSSFSDALAEAQGLGYAEADPTADVGGLDAAAKAAIIATIAFSARVVPDDVYTEGITEVSDSDIASAESLGYVVKLLAVAEEDEGSISVRVHPAMVAKLHPLASVRDSFNAVFIEGEAVGELMLYGRGAGGGPTALALFGDLIDSVKNLASVGKVATIGELVDRPIKPIDDAESSFYVLVEAADEPGVLAAIAGEFGRRGVSIKSMEQRGIGNDARLIFITHRAREADLRNTLESVANVGAVHRIGSVMRVVGEEE